MRKHTLYGLVLLTAVLAALAVLLNAHPFGSAPARLSSLMVAPSEFEALPQGRTEDPTLLQALRCNDYALPAASNTFYYSMIDGDPFALDPLVSVQGKEKLSLAFCENTVDAAFLEAGEALRFVAYTDNAYALGTMHLTTLPTVNITVTEPDEAGSYEIYDRIERDAVMTLFDNRDAVPNRARIVHSDTSIRIRGASSALMPKKSYRLSLSMVSPGENIRHNPLNLLGMRSDEDWILYSPTSDPERLRNSFSNNLWYQSCSENNYRQATLGIECRYVELLLNGEYLGLYCLMYPLDAKQVGLPDDGFYYRGISYDETTPEMLQQAGDELVVGGWELRGPSNMKAKGPERWIALSDYFTSISNSDADEAMEWMTTHLDEDNVIDLHLFLSLVQGFDNYYKNHNLIVYPDQDAEYRILMAPWDMDLAWGNSYSVEGDWHGAYYTGSYDDEFHARWTLPADRMLALSADMRAALLARWRELRAGPWSDAAMMAQLDTYEAQIYASGAMARDCDRWPTAPSFESLDRFRAYVLARLDFLDGYFEEAMK